MIIYKTTNTINGKIYIGKDEFNRKRYLGSGIYLKLAIKKYGRDKFEKSIIDHADNRDDLDEKERFWIKFYDARNQAVGYNIALGGEGFNGRHSEESKLKMRKPKSEQAKLNMRLNHPDTFGENNSFYGARHTDETKKQIGLSSKERNAGKGNPMFGKHHSEETLLKMSLIKKGKRPSEEIRRKLSLSKMGNKNCVGHIPWNKGNKNDYRGKLEFAKREFNT